MTTYSGDPKAGTWQRWQADLQAQDTCPPSAADFPLTCEWCKGAPGTHYLIYDMTGHGRHAAFTCGECVHRTTRRPASVTAWWLFSLVADDPVECTAGESAR